MHEILWLFIAILLAGCSAGTAQVQALPITPAPPAGTYPLEDVFRNTAGISGWTATGQARLYNEKNLFDLVDGQAEAFFAYNFRQVAVQRYRNAAGARVDAEVWELAKPADAFGLFTASANGLAISIGNEGDMETGRRVSFWQERYTVHVSAREKLDDAVLMNFADAISKSLPHGGERPALVNRLPGTGLRARGFIFFRKELSIQDQVWLGGENILGLDPDTDAVLARYDLGGQTARLLLVQYASAGKASAGLRALQSGKIKDVVSLQARENLLGVVFGKADGEAAQRLLAQALQN